MITHVQFNRSCDILIQIYSQNRENDFIKFYFQLNYNPINNALKLNLTSNLLRSLPEKH